MISSLKGENLRFQNNESSESIDCYEVLDGMSQQHALTYCVSRFTEAGSQSGMVADSPNNQCSRH